MEKKGRQGGKGGLTEGGGGAENRLIEEKRKADHWMKY